MEEYSKNFANDPFKLLSKGQKGELTRKLMENHGFSFNEPEDSPHSGVPLADLLPGYGRQEAQHRKQVAEALRLFCWGIGGGISLIAPMLLMVLHNTLLTQLLTQLLTAGISVMLFAFVIASLAAGLVPKVSPIEFGPQGVWSATAAYAAVLVVFISTSS